MNVLVACEYSGRVRDAFIRKGHNAISCDLLPSESGLGDHYQGDVFDLDFNKFDLLIAHPPCTRLANSGVRWLTNPPKGKTKDQIWQEFEAAVGFYKKIRSIPIAKKCIENPVMHRYATEELGDIQRNIVQPWWFGDKTFKATGYELHGLKPLTPTKKLNPPKKGTKEHKEWSWIHLCPPGPNRWKIRSVTPSGIAEAMAEQWG